MTDDERWHVIAFPTEAYDMKLRLANDSDTRERNVPLRLVLDQLNKQGGLSELPGTHQPRPGSHLWPQRRPK